MRATSTVKPAITHAKLRDWLYQFTRDAVLCGFFFASAIWALGERRWGWAVFGGVFLAASAARARSRYRHAKKVIDSAVIQ